MHPLGSSVYNHLPRFPEVNITAPHVGNCIHRTLYKKTDSGQNRLSAYLLLLPGSAETSADRFLW